MPAFRFLNLIMAYLSQIECFLLQKEEKGKRWKSFIEHIWLKNVILSSKQARKKNDLRTIFLECYCYKKDITVKYTLTEGHFGHQGQRTGRWAPSSVRHRWRPLKVPRIWEQTSAPRRTEALNVKINTNIVSSPSCQKWSNVSQEGRKKERKKERKGSGEYTEV